MIEYSENIEVSPVKKTWEKKPRLTNLIHSPEMDKSLKEEDKTNEAGEIKNDPIAIGFNKWIMPSQPQAYIKSPL